MSHLPSRRPPMLPTKRAALLTQMAQNRATLAQNQVRGSHVPMVDVSAIDAGWPEVWQSPVEVLATDVVRRGTGRAQRSQAQLRTAVVRWMEERLDVRELRVGPVAFKLGELRLVPTGDGFEVRSGALRVTLDAARPTPKKPTNLARVGEALRAALVGEAEGYPIEALVYSDRTPTITMRPGGRAHRIATADGNQLEAVLGRAWLARATFKPN